MVTVQYRCLRLVTGTAQLAVTVILTQQRCIRFATVYAVTGEAGHSLERLTRNLHRLIQLEINRMHALFACFLFVHGMLSRMTFNAQLGVGQRQHGHRIALTAMNLVTALTRHSRLRVQCAAPLPEALRQALVQVFIAGIIAALDGPFGRCLEIDTHRVIDTARRVFGIEAAGQLRGMALLAKITVTVRHAQPGIAMRGMQGGLTFHRLPVRRMTAATGQRPIRQTRKDRGNLVLALRIRLFIRRFFSPMMRIRMLPAAADARPGIHHHAVMAAVAHAG